jgi:hypothetical protein
MWQLQQTESPDEAGGDAANRPLSTPLGVRAFGAGAPFDEAPEAASPVTR